MQHKSVELFFIPSCTTQMENRVSLNRPLAYIFDKSATSFTSTRLLFLISIFVQQMLLHDHSTWYACRGIKCVFHLLEETGSEYRCD